MTQLALIASNPAHLPAAQAMHDLRNILASIGLHLETLGRLSGPSGAKPVDAAYALLTRCTAMCNCALDYAANAQSRRGRVDLIHTARQTADLLAPNAPKGFCFDIGQSTAACALADPNDVFRILFNLMSNAVNAANLKANAIKTVTIRVGIEGATLTMQISDDGPGLPAWLQTRLFRTRSKQSNSARHGYGLAIARELAERNGGTLTLAPSTRGTTFELKLAAFVSMLPERAPAPISGRDPRVASFAILSSNNKKSFSRGHLRARIRQRLHRNQREGASRVFCDYVEGVLDVMAGLVPAIHAFACGTTDVDARNESGHNDVGFGSTISKNALMEIALQFVDQDQMKIEVS